MSLDRELWCLRAGVVSYRDALSLQRELAELRRLQRAPDLLLLLQHHPVLSKGRRTDSTDLPMGEQWYSMQGIEVCETDRGGRVTYHGPGQLVAYPIVDLGSYGDDVHRYVRLLEQVMIAGLAEHRVEATVFDGLTGVWTIGDPPLAGRLGPQGTVVAASEPVGFPARKIGSIGIHLSRGITTHGFAINVSNDLQPFEWIVPCGIESVRMTSLSRELGSEQSTADFADTIERCFCTLTGQQAVAPNPDLVGSLATSITLRG